MPGRTAALALAFGGLVLALLAGAFTWAWLRPPLVGAISGGVGVWILRALGEGGRVEVWRWLPLIAAYGAAVGLMAAIGAQLAGMR